MTYFGDITMGKNENKCHCSEGQCFVCGEVWLHFFPRFCITEDGYTPFRIYFQTVAWAFDKKGKRLTSATQQVFQDSSQRQQWLHHNRFPLP